MGKLPVFLNSSGSPFRNVRPLNEFKIGKSFISIYRQRIFSNRAPAAWTAASPSAIPEQCRRVAALSII